MSRGMKINDGKSIKVPLNTFPCHGRGQVLAFFSLLFSPSSPFTPLCFLLSFAALSLAGCLLVGSILGCLAFLSFIRDSLLSRSGIFYFAFSARSSSSISLAFTLASSNTRGTHTFAPFVMRRHTSPPFSLVRPIFEREFSSPSRIPSTILMTKLLAGTSVRMINRRVSKGWKRLFVS